mmetsp:Transcript_4235/g.6456  ORF Transcript_4235/g.6456 Transcript_4235/m.6456 type:complete len:354 (-) Transcript_4235:230-1291(-)
MRKGLLGLFVVRILLILGEEQLCPYDPEEEMKRLQENPKVIRKGKLQSQRIPIFPRHVYYTGPYDSKLKNLTIGQGRWPPEYVFHFYNDTRMAMSMLRLSKELETQKIFGAFDAYRVLRAMAFRADLWRYAILWACGGVYVDSKMQLAIDFDSFISRTLIEHFKMDEVINTTSKKDIILTCQDKWGTRLDPNHNLTAFWQGFLVVTPKSETMLRVIRHVVNNIKNRLYPEEGKLSGLYISGPCAMARAIERDHSDWRAHVKSPCHFGMKGPKMRTIWGPGQDLMIRNDKLHSKLHGGHSHAYPALHQTKQVYYDDPPCHENCHLLKIKAGQFPEDAGGGNDMFFKEHVINSIK